MGGDVEQPIIAYVQIMTSAIIPEPPEVRNISHNISPEEDRATAIGSMYKKIREDRTCSSEDMIADRQTRSSQYSVPLSGAE